NSQKGSRVLMSMPDDAARIVRPAKGRSGDRFDYIFLHSGGVGDICLASDLIASLKNAPRSRVGLICRSGLGPIADLYPVLPDEIIELDINPSTSPAPSPELSLTLEGIVRRLSGVEVDVLLCGDMNMPWLGWFAAAVLRPRRTIVASR